MRPARRQSYSGPSRVVVHLRSTQSDFVEVALCRADAEVNLADFKRTVFRTLGSASKKCLGADCGQMQWVLPPLEELGDWEPSEVETDGAVLGTFDTDNETSEDSVASEYSVEEKQDGTVTHSAERPGGFGLMRISFDEEMRSMLEEAPEDFVFWRLRSLPRTPGSTSEGKGREEGKALSGRREEWLTDDNMVLYSVGQTNQEEVIDLWIRRRSEAPPPQLDSIVTRTELLQDLWGNRYTAYRIALTYGSLRWAISRRFSEFVNLHEALSTESRVTATGGIRKELLPVLPPKVLGRKRSLTPAVVEQRRCQLQEYLDRLLQIPETAGNIHVLHFLGVMSTSRHFGNGLAPVGQPNAAPRQVIHLSKLRGHVSWGSIILFKCANTLSGLQRTVTGAEWDHVAFVAKGRAGTGLELIEATGDGVRSYAFVSRIAAYSEDFAQYMVIRQLHFNRTKEALEKMYAFVKEVEGKEYGFSFSNLVARWGSSKLPKKDAETKCDDETTSSEMSLNNKIQLETQDAMSTEAPEDDTFFCSELVAAFLVAIGALPEDTNSAYFWPGSFGQGGDVDRLLVDGFQIGEEVLIDTKVMEIANAVTEREKSELLRRRRLKARGRNGNDFETVDLWAALPPAKTVKQKDEQVENGQGAAGVLPSDPEQHPPPRKRPPSRSGGSMIAKLLGANRNF